MASFIVTCELSAEDRARLDRLIAALEQLAHQTPTQAVKETPPTALTAPALEPIDEKPLQQELPKAEKTVDRSAVRNKVVDLSKKGHKDKVRDIVTKYAGSVSLIPDDQLAQVFAELTALEG